MGGRAGVAADPAAGLGCVVAADPAPGGGVPTPVLWTVGGAVGAGADPDPAVGGGGVGGAAAEPEPAPSFTTGAGAAADPAAAAIGCGRPKTAFADALVDGATSGIRFDAHGAHTGCPGPPHVAKSGHAFFGFAFWTTCFIASSILIR